MTEATTRTANRAANPAIQAPANVEIKRRIADAILPKECEDSLTGLGNRRHLDERLLFHVTRLTQVNESLSLIFADMDGLHEINSRLKHEGGDAAIRAFADTITETVRKDEIICRRGGDEFVVVLPHSDEEHANAFKARLNSALFDRKISASFGSATITGLIDSDPKVIEEKAKYLLSLADERMYAQKKAKKIPVMLRKLMLRTIPPIVSTSSAIGFGLMEKYNHTKSAEALLAVSILSGVVIVGTARNDILKFLRTYGKDSSASKTEERE